MYTLRENLSPFFTAGRPHGVLGLVLHHGATTNFDGIGATFKTRGVSAGYGVAPGRVDLYVHDNNTAYHAGVWDANQRYIGIEHVNSNGAPEWKISPDTIETSTHLSRDLVIRHNLGRLTPFENIFPHGHFTPTFCPGVLKDMISDYSSQVNELLGQTPLPSRKSNDEIASEVMKGLWGNGDDRRRNLQRAGYDYNVIQGIVNARINGTWQAPTAPQPSISTIARQVIAGSFGNSPHREANLRRAGHDPVAVQNEVNRMLGVGGAPVPSGGIFAVGQNVVVTNPVDYNGARLYTSGVYRVMEVRGDRIVIGRGGQVTAAIKNTNIRRA